MWMVTRESGFAIISHYPMVAVGSRDWLDGGCIADALSHKKK
jgi:hypothetical protein